MAVNCVTKPIDNLKVCRNYIRTGHNTTHTFKRACEVAVDTVKINTIAESKPLIGPALSGRSANGCAEKYSRKMVTDYNLVDSLKQKALQRKLIKMFGKDYKVHRTNGRPMYNWEEFRATSPANTTSVGDVILKGDGGIVDYPGSSRIKIPTNSTNTKLRGGGQFSENTTKQKFKISLASFFNFIMKYRYELIYISIFLIFVFYCFRIYRMYRHKRVARLF